MRVAIYLIVSEWIWFVSSECRVEHFTISTRWLAEPVVLHGPIPQLVKCQLYCQLTVCKPHGVLCATMEPPTDDQQKTLQEPQLSAAPASTAKVADKAVAATTEAARQTKMTATVAGDHVPAAVRL